MAGHIAYVNEWRRLFAEDNHKDRLVVANSSNLTDHIEDPLPERMRAIYNGGWIEHLSQSEAWGGWDTMMAQYRRGMRDASEPKLVMFHHNISRTRQRYPNLPESGWSDFRWNRYFLASALMDNGYYIHSGPDYSNKVWFDEFDVSLGYSIDPPQYAAWSKGVYRREFEGGLVLVNPKGNGSQTVNVGVGWRRFLGVQDPNHNNGAFAEQITLQAQDGIILLRDGAVPKPVPPAGVSIE